MKIRIEKNYVAFCSPPYDFSISRDCIYLTCFSKDLIKFKNWIYGTNDNKNIIETQLYYKKYIK